MEDIDEGYKIATACVAVELLHRSGMKKQEAQQHVANRLNFSHVTLRNFAKNICGEQPRAPQASIDIYWRQLSIAKNLAAEDLESTANVLLDALCESR